MQALGSASSKAWRILLFLTEAGLSYFLLQVPSVFLLSKYSLIQSMKIVVLILDIEIQPGDEYTLIHYANVFAQYLFLYTSVSLEPFLRHGYSLTHSQCTYPAIVVLMAHYRWSLADDTGITGLSLTLDADTHVVFADAPAAGHQNTMSHTIASNTDPLDVPSSTWHTSLTKSTGDIESQRELNQEQDKEKSL